ncbi:hypothetical protein MUK72_13270 [Halococcus dombrowskii]|nr:hypothetical protein [Halococcus dombrowskii]UOO94929.1 hypothetical protein MUK72_13270 [Halococcus dombrowskii]
MARYGDLNYGWLTKHGFGLGVALFVLGALGSIAGPALFGPLPGWEATLFTDSEVAGIVIAFFSVMFFGIVLPLTE